METTPESKPWYTSKLTWVGIGLLAASTLEFLAKDELTPDWLDKFLLAAAGILVIIFRTVTVQPIANRVLTWLLIGCLLAAPQAYAEEVAVLVNDSNPGTYLLTVNADKTVTVNPIRVVRPGANPTPAPTPQPQPVPATVLLSKTLAEQALAKPGATKQTGAGLSAVYSAVSREINSGGLDPKLATTAIALGVSEVYKKATAEDKSAWTVYSTSISRALSEASVAGDLATTGKWVAILDDFHKGIDLATGVEIEIGTLLSIEPNRAGILDGINLQQLIELIKLIIEIIKAFKTP